MAKDPGGNFGDFDVPPATALSSGILNPPTLTPVTKKTGGSGGSGGSGGAAAPNRSLANTYFDWFGYEPSAAWLAQAKLDGTTADDVRRLAVAQGGNGWQMQQARQLIHQSIWSVYGDPNALPDSLVNSIISDGFWNDQNYLQGTYLPGLKDSGIDVTKSPELTTYIDWWTEQTGKPLTWTAQQFLDNLVKMGDITTDTLSNQWKAWIPTTQSALTGNYGADARARISNLYVNILGRQATTAELDPANFAKHDAAIIEEMKKSPEYQAIYAGKPDWMTEQDFITLARSLNEANIFYYGPTEGQEQLAGVPDLGTGPPQGGGPTSNAPGGATGNPLAVFGIGGVTPAEVVALANSGLNVTDVINLRKIHEEAVFQGGTLDPVLQETLGRTLTHDEWETYVAGGKDSGALRLEIAEAQNKIAYREVFRDYFGTDPSPADYAAITEQFVSPQEFVHRKAATESAKAQFPAIDELLNRIYGRGTTQQELENLAMGGQGSGELKARIDQATKLDEYRWTFKKMNNGLEPGPDDYAKFAGYAGPAELEFELALNEKVAEMTPDINELWQQQYNTTLSDEDMRILLGGTKGSGAIAAQYNKAKEKQTKEEAARASGYTGERAWVPWGATQAGGIGVSNVGLPDLGT
jgi:hypothetical protein